MATVLPFDPHARRRTPTTPATPTRPRGDVERVVPIPVTRTADLATAVAAPVAVAAPARPAPISERALARRFFPLVALVALADLATKAIAVAGLGEQTIALGGPLSLQLVYNTASAGGVWLGAHTRELNMVATGIVIGMLVMLVPVLARLDRHAPTALALMAGGGVGNLSSLVSSTRGVPDFLALRHEGGAWIMNVADLFMFAGLLLLVRTIAVLALAMREHGPRQRASAVLAPR